MRQILHLLVVGRSGRRALVGRIGGKWLLPVIPCAERTRAAPLVGRWCNTQGLPVDVAGQWLGRIGEDSLDWLIVAIADEHSTPRDIALTWTPLPTLGADAVLDYQQWAVRRAVARELSVDGPFGNLAWPAEVCEWISAHVDAPIASVTPYRVSAHDVVLGVDYGGRRV